MKRLVVLAAMVLVISFMLFACGDETDYDEIEGFDEGEAFDQLDESRHESRYPGPSSIRNFKWPVVRNQKVKITAGYGPRGGSPYHSGTEYHALDLVNGNSSRHTRWMWVLNPARGIVKQIGYSSSRGHYIIMNHGNGWESRIYHLQTSPRDFTTEGHDLLRGTFLGYTGSTGWSSGPHIHFVVLKNGLSVSLNGIDGDRNLMRWGTYKSSNDYVRPPWGRP